jgi:hypothetical protein
MSFPSGFCNWKTLAHKIKFQLRQYTKAASSIGTLNQWTFSGGGEICLGRLIVLLFGINAVCVGTTSRLVRSIRWLIGGVEVSNKFDHQIPPAFECHRELLRDCYRTLRQDASVLREFLL